MSLKVSLEVDNTQHSLELACIMPAALQELAHDYSNGRETIIVGACAPDDQMGFVYGVNTAIWSQLRAGVDPQSLNVTPVLTIELGATRAAHFTPASGRAGRLIFTHIAGYVPPATVQKGRKK